MRARRIGTLAVVLGASALPSSASGRVAHSRSGAAMHWDRAAIELTIAGVASSGGPSREELRGALESGAAAWNAATQHCDVPRLIVRDRLENTHWLAKDGRNLVMVRGRAQCTDDASVGTLCSDRSAAARTHVYPETVVGGTDPGQIAEVDLELNAVSYQWKVDESGPGVANLRRAVHHELGHVLGLDHPCEEVHLSAMDRGAPLPNCQIPAMAQRLMRPTAAVAMSPISLVPDAADVDELCRHYGEKRRAWHAIGRWVARPSVALGSVGGVVLLVIGLAILRARGRSR